MAAGGHRYQERSVIGELWRICSLSQTFLSTAEVFGTSILLSWLITDRLPKVQILYCIGIGIVSVLFLLTGWWA